MSRKHKSKPASRPEVLDTGGLDLNKFATPPSQHAENQPEQQNAVTGKLLFEALADSSFVHLAARRVANTLDVLVVSNGMRFWTADAASFAQIFVEGVPYGGPDERTRWDWLSVVGSESGLRLA